MVKKRRFNKGLAILVTLLWFFPVFAQISPEQVKQYLSSKKNNGFVFFPDVKEFYAGLNYQTAWIQKANSGNYTAILNTLQAAPGLGLNENDYQFTYIQALRNNTARLENAEDSLEAEIRITDAAIHFYSDIAYGNTKPSLGYNGLNYSPGCRNITGLLADAISKRSLQLLTGQLSPVLPEISILEQKIKWYHTIMTDNNFKEVIITSGKVNPENKSLLLRLYQLGFIDSVNKKLTDSILKQRVKDVQYQFGLQADGILHKTTIQNLNIPLSTRLKQLSLSLNYYRWLNCLTQNQSVIVVNIPAAYMKVYNNNNVILEMRMVVGKKATPTATLTSMINNVILYPYWHVPYSIATKELLPSIRRNPGYINAGNYQVLNRAGNIVNPYSVNWNAVSAANFPYLIRQSTGCDNALGLLKLDFYNPFGAYLHDTPSKSLFKQNRRFYSHGCMRMEKPLILGHLVLKNNKIAIDTLEQKGCLRNQSPITVPANVHMPVVVWYNPAAVDSTGRLQFFEDIYRKFNW